MTDFPIQTPQQLGPILRGFRSERKLTQQAVGQRSGLAQNVISRIEAKPGPTSLAQIFKVLAALNLELVVRPRKASDSRLGW